MSPDGVKCPLGDKIIPGLKLKNKTKHCSKVYTFKCNCCFTDYTYPQLH